MTKELTVLNEHGLHARPAAEFVQCVLAAKSRVYLVVHGNRYRADRIMEVLLANLNHGNVFILEAEGPDAEETIESLERLLLHLKENDEQPVPRSAISE